MNIKELAKQVGISFGGHPMNPLSVYFSELTRFAELVAAAERNRCIEIIEHYQIPVGNSAAGEIACEMTYMALRDIRDQINGEVDDE